MKNGFLEWTNDGRVQFVEHPKGNVIVETMQSNKVGEVFRLIGCDPIEPKKKEVFDTEKIDEQLIKVNLRNEQFVKDMLQIARHYESVTTELNPEYKKTISYQELCQKMDENIPEKCDVQLSNFILHIKNIFKSKINHQ